MVICGQTQCTGTGKYIDIKSLLPRLEHFHKKIHIIFIKKLLSKDVGKRVIRFIWDRLTQMKRNKKKMLIKGLF